MTYTSEKIPVAPSIVNERGGVKKKEIPKVISGVVSVEGHAGTRLWKRLIFLESAACG